MELAFTTKQLRQLCESSAKAKKELGDEMAEKLKHRISDLRAAVCTNDLLVGDPRELNYSGEKAFTIDLGDDLSIFFCANHNKNPTFENGKIDWDNVSRIRILNIGSHHDQ